LNPTKGNSSKAKTKAGKTSLKNNRIVADRIEEATKKITAKN